MGSERLNSAKWRKSSYSGSGGGNCVEVMCTGTVLIRDSKDPHGIMLTFGPKDWQRFADRLKACAPDTTSDLADHPWKGRSRGRGCPLVSIRKSRGRAEIA